MFKAFTKPFARNEEGSLSVEAVFAVPILVWAITATFVFWDAFKTMNISQKATYTVADMLSRETKPIDEDYMSSMHEIYDFLSGQAGSNAIRVSVVTVSMNAATNTEELELLWSEGKNTDGHADVEPLRQRLPTIGLGEQLIIVESEQEWSPAFAVGLASYRFYEVAISRPRFTPQVCWQPASGALDTCSAT